MIGRRRFLGAAGVALASGCVGVESRAAAADVRGFGAKGDGATDDALAIQATIDSDAPAISFPPGRYAVGRSLHPRSGQSWIGAGNAVSVLLADGAAPFNLVETLGRLEDVEFRDLGLAGTLPRRVAGDQRGFGLYLRGEQRRITLRSCAIENFAGGGVVIGPAPGGDEAQALDDIAVIGCRFANNANVPGLYIGSGDRPGGTILVRGNRFSGAAAGNHVQNCVYILGSATGAIRDADIRDNIFDIGSSVDACIELNFVDGFTISGNVVTITAGLDGSSGILLRDGCRHGTVTGNTLADRTDGKQIGGVLLLNFANPGTVETVSVTGNDFTGFTWRALAIDRGSRAIVATGNRISGGDRTTSEAIRIAGAHDVLVAENQIERARYPILIAGRDASRVDAVTIRGNAFTDCGGADALIEAGEAPDLANLTVTGNRVRATRVGTRHLIGGIVRHSAVAVHDNLAGGLPIAAWSAAP